MDIHLNEPKFFGENIIRFESFLSDFNTLMDDKELNWSVTESLSYLIKKYELLNLTYFNSDAYDFLFLVFYRYYKKLKKNNYFADPQIGEEEKDVSLLRKLRA